VKINTSYWGSNELVQKNMSTVFANVSTTVRMWTWSVQYFITVCLNILIILYPRHLFLAFICFCRISWNKKL